MAHFYEKYYNQEINIQREWHKLVNAFENDEYYFQIIEDNLANELNQDFLLSELAGNSKSIHEPLAFIKNESIEESFYDYCEFLLSLFFQLQDRIRNTTVIQTIRHIKKIIFTDLDLLNLEVKYIDTKQGEVAIIVVKDQLLEEVTDIVDSESIRDRLIEYRAKKNDGNVARKEEILKIVAEYVEGFLKDNSLKLMNTRLFDDTGFLYNNLNIRHNNTKVNETKYYEATKSNREKWLDYLYQEILLVIISVKEKKIHEDIEALKGGRSDASEKVKMSSNDMPKQVQLS